MKRLEGAEGAVVELGKVREPDDAGVGDVGGVNLGDKVVALHTGDHADTHAEELRGR